MTQGVWVDPRPGLEDLEKRKIVDSTGTQTLTPWPSILAPSGRNRRF
jgi:hypothetical protein